MWVGIFTPQEVTKSNFDENMLWPTNGPNNRVFLRFGKNLSFQFTKTILNESFCHSWFAIANSAFRKVFVFELWP